MSQLEKERPELTLHSSRSFFSSTLYRCDNKFQTEALSELLDSDTKFGFIIMDGSGTVSSRIALQRPSNQLKLHAPDFLFLRAFSSSEPFPETLEPFSTSSLSIFPRSMVRRSSYSSSVTRADRCYRLALNRTRRTVRSSILAFAYGGSTQLRPKGCRALGPALHHRRQGQRPGYCPRRIRRLQVRAQPQ